MKIVIIGALVIVLWGVIALAAVAAAKAVMTGLIT